MLDISVVTYNSSKWLLNFFKSLANQELLIESINLYCTDNGSNDDTIHILQEMKNKYNFARFEILQQDNLGFGSGHNNNFKNMISDFVLVTNVDLEYEKDSIKILLDFARKDCDKAASWEMRQKPFEHPKTYNPVTLETSWSSSACVLFRRSALLEVNGYEPRIFMYGEDVDISWRLRARGYILRYLPDAVCWHYTYEESIHKSTQFLGSLLANLLLRARFGSLEDIKIGEKAYKQQIRSKQNLKYKPRLIKNYLWYKKNFKYFRNNDEYAATQVAKFENIWDYEIHRSGAFYKCLPIVKSGPLVSILIRTYQKRGALLKDAIQSVINQTYKNFEIIVVEDGSEALKLITDHFHDDRIKYFSTGNKAGRCVAGNLALEMSKGEYCIFLDDDDYFYADHIETLANEALSGANKKAVVYTNGFIFAEDFLKDENNDFRHSSCQKLKGYYAKPFNSLTILEHNLMPIQAVMFARYLYEQCGGFDISLEYLEDWALWVKYSSQVSFYYVDKTTSLYRIPADEIESKNRVKVLDDYYQEIINRMDSLYFNQKLSLRVIRDMLLENKNNDLQQIHFSYTNSRSWKIVCLLKYIKNKIVSLKKLCQ